MRHGVYGFKLSRNKNERRRLLQNLARDLVKHGRIKTTVTKARAVRSMVEQLVTTAKKNDKNSYRRIFQVLGDRPISQKLISEAGKRFSKRTSGYTRMLRVSRRLGDGSEEVLLSYVDEMVAPVEQHVMTQQIEGKKEVVKTGTKIKNKNTKKKTK